MESNLREIKVFELQAGVAPFIRWLRDLKDVRGRQVIQARLDRARFGNFGETRFVGKGVQELKVNFGPGYRVYFAVVSGEIILLLAAGDKSSQEKDIQLAQRYLAHYEREQKNAGG